MRRWVGILLGAFFLLAGSACSDVTLPEQPVGGTLAVLNSVGQTIVQFDVNGGLERVGSEIVLPEQFDGDAIDVLNPFFVVSVSSFGGSQLVFGDLDTGETQLLVFPEPEATEVNPSKPTFGRDQAGRTEIWVAGRGDDAIYRVRPAESEVAERLSEGVGRWVERVVPVDENTLAAIDANLGDDFQPVGPARVFLLTRNNATVQEEITLEGAFNATDVLTAERRLVVLAGGTFAFEEGAFVPQGDGRVVLVDATTASVVQSFPLEGNGISIRPGRDGLAYVVRTGDFETTDVLSLDPFAGVWVRGPDDPIRPLAADGSPVDCWTAIALQNGRLLCATFRAEQTGSLHLFGEDERSASSLATGFGSTDLVFRR